MHKLRAAFPYWLLSLMILALDLYTKAQIESHLVYGEHYAVTSFFDVVRYHNPGAAFSFLAQAGGWQTWFFTGVSTIVSVFLLVWIVRTSNQKLFCLALALILGGALGNLYDRVTLGYVIDFLYFYYRTWAWPAFNIADSAICIGVGLLLLEGWQRKDAPES